MENFILDSVSFIGNIDFAFVVRMFFYIYLFFWLMVVIWVWFDASERSSNVVFKVFSVIVTLLFNIFGLLIYLLVRPADSYEERYLSELEKKYLQLETSGVIKCPSCSFDLEPGFVVCPRCGESVKVKCKNCEEYIDSYWEFCAYCGIKRDIPEGFKQEFLKKESKDIEIPKSYYFALKQCLYKIGEKQNMCIEKIKEFFNKSDKGKKKAKVKVKKAKPKSKKKGRRKKK